MGARKKYSLTLECQLKAALAQLKAYRSGEATASLRTEHDRAIARKDTQIRKLKSEVAQGDRMLAQKNREWVEVLDDVTKECDRKIERARRALEDMEGRALRAERKCDGLQDKLRDITRQLYAALTDLEEAMGLAKKLQAQIDRDFETSPTPSSMCPNRKAIPNSREKTGRKKGGQPGHKGHPRAWHEPTSAPVDIPPPGEFLDAGRYSPTGRTIRKQRVGLRVALDVTEYRRSTARPSSGRSRRAGSSMRRSRTAWATRSPTTGR
ncbi:MAG: hypothetical protein LBR77_00050 [Lachnospiraceae bacterium]|jgi:hypothetical protein|nr:hypothetical protein [Lachnospiraceae bacterium]